MSNPLLAKYDELYGPKKEEPNKIEIEGTAQISKDQMDVLEEYLELEEYIKNTNHSTRLSISAGVPIVAVGSTASVPRATGSNNWITANNSYVTAKPKSIITYDTQNTNDVFLQIAEKVKDKTAVVTSVSMEIDQVGGFTTGLKTCTFTVEVYGTP